MKKDRKSSIPVIAENITRRGFLTVGLVTAATVMLPMRTLGAVRNILTPERTLSFYNTHTGEQLRTTYWCQGELLPEALDDINYILRDYRTGEVLAIDPRLLNLLYALRKELDARSPYHIISGYRSQKTNELLRQSSRGVAKDSLHTEGMAIDIRLPGIELDELRRAALSLKRGGVGYYTDSEFVHVDVGRVRYW
jgi:uncharacterized protein YcbK (DUF882 family)